MDIANGFDSPGRGGRSSKASRETYHKLVAPSITEREQAVLAVIKQHREGITPKEVARAMHVEHHTISGRFKALRELGLIHRTEDRREDSAVYVPVVAAEQVSLFGEAA